MSETGKDESRTTLRFIPSLVEFTMTSLTEIKNMGEGKGFVMRREMLRSHLGILSLRCL